MDTSTLVYCIIALFVAIIGCYIFVIKMLSRFGEKVVYKDVCLKTQDCIEGEIKHCAENIGKLDTKLDSHFTSLQNLIISNGKT